MITSLKKVINRISPVFVHTMVVLILSAGLLYKNPAEAKMSSRTKKRIAITVGAMALTGGLAGGLGGAKWIAPGLLGGGLIGGLASKAVKKDDSDDNYVCNGLRCKNKNKTRLQTVDAQDVEGIPAQ